MKTPLLPFAALAALLLSSCMSATEYRIKKNPDLFAKLNDHQKDLVEHGEIENGMTRDAVFLAWGNPNHASKGEKKGKAFERWSYTGWDAVPAAPFYPYYGMGVGGVYLHGRHHFGFAYEPVIYDAPAFAYLPYEAAHVVFENNTVTEWAIGPEAAKDDKPREKR